MDNVPADLVAIRRPSGRKCSIENTNTWELKNRVRNLPRAMSCLIHSLNPPFFVVCTECNVEAEWWPSSSPGRFCISAMIRHPLWDTCLYTMPVLSPHRIVRWALQYDLINRQHLPIESTRGARVKAIIRCGRITDADAECILSVHMLTVDGSDSSRSAGFMGL